MNSTRPPHPSTNDLLPIPATVPQSGGLGRVAGRIAGRTTDLIAVGLVLIGSLTFGRQAVIWWRTDPEEVVHPAALAESPNPWNTAPVEIEFGNAPLSLNRQTVAGDRDAALSRLVAECRSAVRNPANAPLESPAAESLLSRLSSLKPIEGDPEEWAVYRLEDQFSVVVGVRKDSAFKAGSDPPQPRLICFGMAVPAGESEWTLFLFRGMKGESSGGGSPSSDLVPDGFRQVLGLRSQQGESMTGVAGRGDAQRWKSSLESKLRSSGWQMLGEWSVVDRTWSAEFEPAEGEGNRTLRIVMTSDDDDRWTGFIHESP